MGEDETSSQRGGGRTFLVVVDDSEELSKALRFACRRAVKTGGRVALLYVIEPTGFQHWMGVGQRMEEERRQEAEELLNVIAAMVAKRTERLPVFHIREGDVREQLLELIEEDTSISVLVLGAATSDKGPGPLVNYLMTKMAGQLRIPITVVPGSLTDADIDAVS